MVIATTSRSDTGRHLANATTQAQMANDRGQVSDSSLETEVLNVSVAGSHPAMVVADHRRSETDQPVRDFPRVRKSVQ